jgi:UDP-glucose 4-epimerase
MNILVAGGAGYIGTHTCVSLIEAGYDVTIVDNFSNSKFESIEKLEKLVGKSVPFYNIDVTNGLALDRVFLENQFQGVIHFAGYKAVGDSVKRPLDYYYNNVVSTIELARACLKHGVGKFVFSSSATVYGNNSSPLKEDMELLPTTNPYGESKSISERILTDFSQANKGKFSVAVLRYFNPVGAHESGIIGEDPTTIPNNLLPYISKVAIGKISELTIFGDDYNTIDGTGVRDYIHVMDLAEGHVAALNSLKGVQIYNLGTGKGTSVLELVRNFEITNNVKVPYTIKDRRSGDIGVCFADANKAKEELNWTTKRNLGDICSDAWRFELSLIKNVNK